MSNSKNTLKRMLDDFYPYAKDYLEFDKDASINFASDETNAKNPLGKTAYYDPANHSVTVYTNGRHPKDIMRSVSHELVHHTQNCRGDLNMSEHSGVGYAQNDEHLRNMEREAYEKGNLCFRDWEDGIKSNLQPGTIYEQKAHRSKKSMNNFKTLNENFKKFLKEDWQDDPMGGMSGGDSEQYESLVRDTIEDILEMEGTSIQAIRSPMQLARLVGQVMQQPGVEESGLDEDAIMGLIDDMQQGMMQENETGSYKAGDKVTVADGGSAGTVVEVMAGGEVVLELEDGSIVKAMSNELEPSGGDEPMQEAEGKVQEYGDHETQAQGGMVSSSQSSDPELDQIADIARTVIEGGGSLHDLKQPLEAEAFDVQATNRFIIVKTTNGDIGIASAKNVELTGGEELIDTPYGQLAVGRINQGQMEEGFRDSDEEKEMTSKMSNKEFSDYHTRDKHLAPDLKGDMGPLDGMEGPFQFRSGAVLYYDNKAGKYYDRGKDMYIDNEEASKLTMERNQMKLKSDLREKVKASVTSKLKEMYDDDDMFGDEDPYMAGLEAEFPWMADKKKKKAAPMGDDEAAMAAAAADAAAAGEFEVAPEEEEEVPSVTMREGNFAEYGAIDAQDGNPPSKIGQGDEAYMEAYNAVLVARGEEPLPVVQPDQAYLDALQSGSMKPADHSYNMEEGEEEVSHETTLRDRVMAKVQETLAEKAETTEEHDDDPALKGDQDELPDALQKNIIDKADGDDEKKEEALVKEEAEEEEEVEEEVEESVAPKAEDFFRQLRNESRVVGRPEWSQESRTKRTSVLNERLMKAWFDK